MKNIHSFPKILAVGSEQIKELFDDPVEMTEKIDGSMFAFGISEDGELVFRSKGKELFEGAIDKMFQPAVDYVLSIKNMVLGFAPNTFFYTEFLGKPKHNTLAYERVPKNNLMLFGAFVKGSWVDTWEELDLIAADLDIEMAPILGRKKIESIEDVKELLETTSVLGNETIEGIVFKNYKKTWMLGSRVHPMFGKYVRAEFKERHGRVWKTGKDKFAEFLDGFRTEARWQKAIQHLKECGELSNSPKDIGKLLKEIHQDLETEETENIKVELYNFFIKQIKRKSCAGFPEFYKEQLLLGSLEGDKKDE